MSRDLYDSDGYRTGLAQGLHRPIGFTEWGTDVWGEILSEPNEAHARSVAGGSGSKLYSRSPMSHWVEVPFDDLDTHSRQAREAVEQ